MAKESNKKMAKVEILSLMIDPTIRIEDKIESSRKAIEKNGTSPNRLVSDALQPSGEVWQPGEVKVIPLEIAEKYASKRYRGFNQLMGEIKPNFTHKEGDDVRPIKTYLKILEIIGGE